MPTPHSATFITRREAEHARLHQASAQAGEDAAQAVADMRHEALGDREQLARFTQAVLAETNLSFREQEPHSGVAASVVYQMSLGKPVNIRSVRQFAGFAGHRARDGETRQFWQQVFDRITAQQNRNGGADCDSAANAANALAAAAMTGGEAVCEEQRSTEAGRLYDQLTLPESREAVVRLLRALLAAEVSMAPPRSPAK